MNKIVVWLLDKNRGIKMMKNKRIYERYIKRYQDFILAVIAIVILLPIIVIVAILVKIKLGSPIIFKQERPGKNEKIFVLYKFRTMLNSEVVKADSDEIRLTSFGKKLRATSLDELPELFNVLKGDMSIVGPRPLLVSYLERYNDIQKRRHEVRPGITGLAQVNGRNSISWSEKFEFDVEYVDHITFFGDLRIILDTILTVIRKDGINSATSATMEEFLGDDT